MIIVKENTLYMRGINVQNPFSGPMQPQEKKKIL